MPKKALRYPPYVLIKEYMLVSFIVVVFNEEKSLPLVKAAFDRLVLPEGVTMETIAVDGGSRDGSVEAARNCGFSKVVELPGANIPVCRNAGIKESSGEVIAFVDGDCILDPDWLVHAFRLLNKHPRLVLGWPASPPSPGTWVQRAWHAHWMNKNPAMENDAGESVVKKGGFRLITTRNMILHRSVTETIGGFDEALSTGEDTDFVFRATMADIPAWGLPALKSVHLGEPDTLKRFFRQQVWHANRLAYKTIVEKSGMKSGGNAPLFTGLFLAGLILVFISIPAGIFLPALWLGLFPLPALLFALAVVTAKRAMDFSLIPPLMVLYGAYGLARCIDLLGFSPRKASWKLARKK
ncbi:MAG TPA: glycosyltransferase [Kiritimatiellia bacterium]|nr:glycosyltransferase [Kiritimatiellia bacterium]